MRYIDPKQSVAEPLIKQSGVLYLDTETRGTSRRDEIVMLIIATPKHSFLWDTRDNGWPKWINYYLQSLDYLKIIHNGLFDGTLIQTQHGVRIRRIKDTMLQEKIILGTEVPFGIKDENIKRKYSIGLKYCLQRYKLSAKKDFDSRVFRDWHQGFTKEMLNYGFGDVEQLGKLCDLQEQKIKKQKLENVQELENSVLEVFIQMRVRGIGFNRELWLQIADGYNDEFNEHKRLFDQMLKREARTFNREVKGDKERMPEEINVNSPKQVKELFALRGIVIESYTDFKRQYSMNKVEYNDKLLDAFFDMREFYQLANTFGEKWLHENDPKREPTVDQVDFRVHPDFTQIISTGRSSCNDPNLQQLPGYAAYEMGGGHPRNAFVATKGYTIFNMDYKGQEFALMMLLAREEKWLEYIRLGYDTHSMLSQMAQPREWAEAEEPGCEFKKSKKACNCKEHKQLRTYTKKIIFGKPYGKGITSIAEDLAITYDEAKPRVRAIERTLPKTMRWMETCKNQALKDKAVWTLPPFRRYRKLEFFVAPKSRFSDKEETEEVNKAFKGDYFATKGDSKDSWRRKMIADNTDWRVKNQGVNSPIQGSGADMLKSAMVKMQKFIDSKLKHNPKNKYYVYTEEILYPAHILLPVHDAVMSEALDKIAKEWEKVAVRLMEEAATEITQGIDLIRVDVKQGKAWK